MTADGLADAVGESAHKFELHLKLFGFMPMSNAVHVSAYDRPKIACCYRASCSYEPDTLLLPSRSSLLTSLLKSLTLSWLLCTLSTA